MIGAKVFEKPPRLGEPSLVSSSWQDRSSGLNISHSTSSLHLSQEASAIAKATSKWLLEQDDGAISSPQSPQSPSTGKHRDGFRHRDIWSTQDTSWLDDVRQEANASTEWQTLTRQIYQHVQRSLEKHTVVYFGDLSEDEKMLMLDDIEESLSEGSVYRNFEKVLSEKVEDGLLKQLSRRPANLTEKFSSAEAIVELASHGVNRMLNKMPSKVAAIRMLMNRQLPDTLREQVWELYLQDAEALKAFRNRVNARRMATIASTDTEVTERCQEIFEKEFPEIVDSSSLIMLGKTVLSYRATAFGDIDKAHFYWLIPILVVFAKSYNDLPRVVEAMHALTRLPKIQVSTGPMDVQDSLRRVKYSDELAKLLRTVDNQLHEHLMEVIQKHIDSDDTDEPSRLGFQHQSPQSRLLTLFADPLNNLFVGTLQMESCLFVWDQCLIVGFDRLALRIACCILLLLREQLLDKSSMAGLEQVVLHQAKGITCRQLSRTMESRFFSSIRAEFGVANETSTHWNSAPVKPLSRDDLEKNDDLKDLALTSHVPTRPESELDVLRESSPSNTSESAEEVKAKLEKRAIEHQQLSDDKSSTRTGAAQLKSSEDSSNWTSKDSDSILVPKINLKVHRFADMLKRTRELNPRAPESAVKSKLISEEPSFADQNPDAPVLRTKVGETVCHFRALDADESQDMAKEIISCELERANEKADGNQINALIKHLLHFSKAKAKLDGKVKTASKEVQSLEQMVHKLADALHSLRTGRFQA